MEDGGREDKRLSDPDWGVLFGSVVDDYRVARTLIQDAVSTRVVGNYRVGDLVAAAGILSSDVSKIQNIGGKRIDRDGKVERLVGKSKVARLLIKGLRLHRDLAEAILWLLFPENHRIDPATDGMTPEDVGPASPLAGPRRWRELIYAELEHIVAQHRERGLNSSQDEANSARVRIFWSTEEDRVQSDRGLQEMERIPGQLMFQAARPSHLTRPPEFLQNIATIDPLILEDSNRQRMQAIRLERYRIRLHALERYGMRSINATEEIERYINSEPKDSTDVNGPRAHIRNVIALARRYPKFEVALTERLLPMEFRLKSLRTSVLRAYRVIDRERPATGLSVLGPHYIFFDDQFSVLQLYIEFERAWSSAIHKGEAAIAWLWEALGEKPDDHLV